MEAERRQVSVLFSDLVGFTSFSERSGEEAAFTLMRSLATLMDDAVRGQGGVVQSFTGDGIMAVFGAPVALEDAPLRACRASLAILQQLDASGEYLKSKYGVRPQMRIGLNTGVAIVGKVQGGADAAVTVLGDTVNVASRLQTLAEPDSVVMSEAMQRLVQGMVEISFTGEHQIKGKAEPQKLYRLDRIRQGAVRFEAAVSRGLSTFVGREREFELLERSLDKARSGLCVIDLAAEPGMGKSRLLYEFRQRIGKGPIFLIGSCSSDGQQTPFLPFIEVVRGSFRISVGEAEKEIAQKLEMGLTSLGLHSARNLGLLLHLLGLKAPEDALTGLDGVLIGLRTRELLQHLLEERCRLSPVVMMIEDLHWIDSVSEELLAKIIDRGGKLRLLLLTTRRPEYSPPWLDCAVVTTLPLEPLPTGDIRHLVQVRLGVETLPEALAWQVTEKAEGNPLFAEEITTFLTERGILRTVGGKLDFDASAMASGLPASVQGVLTARVDRLAPKDRALLQTASVIGRRFDPQLLVAVTDETEIEARLAAMQTLDLVRAVSNSSDYEFKHALVRDALFHSLLSETRAELHLRIADEIEHRSGNRLSEVAEVLAYHYSQTGSVEKAFAFLSMAGAKSLSVYSLDEASAHLSGALALLDKNSDCASDDQVADFLASYTLQLHLSVQFKPLIDVVKRYLVRIDRLGDDQRAVLIRHHYIFTLFWNARYREAAAVQRETSPIADRLGDNRSRAYALAGEIFVSIIISPKRLDEFEILKREAINAASNTADAHIQNITRWVIGWEEFHRGRMLHARASARELIQVGSRLDDPRSTGLGLALLAWIALMSDSYAEAIEYSERSLAVAVTPWDRNFATISKGCALVLLGQTEEGAKLLEQDRHRCLIDGDLYALNGSDAIVGVCKIFQGRIREGIHIIEEAILRREKEGYRVAADWYRGFLAEVYLQVIAGEERLPLPVLLRNIPILLRMIFTASSRIQTLMTHVLDNPNFDPAGFSMGRAQMILGLLYKAKKKRALAFQHLTEAKRIFSQFGHTPVLARVETALAGLGQ